MRLNSNRSSFSSTASRLGNEFPSSPIPRLATTTTDIQMPPTFLTQALLIAQLREELGLHVGTAAIHKWIREGMPVAPAPGTKPRFIWAHVRNWLLGQEAPTTPLSQKVRDQVFRSSVRKGA